MNTYKKYAFAIQILSSIMIFASTIITFAYWFVPTTYQKFSSNGLLLSCDNFDTTTLTVSQKIMGFFVSGISTGLLIFALFLIIKLMKYMQNNEYFSLHTIALLKRITKIALIYAIYTPISNTILSLITSFNNPVGQRTITLTFGSAEILNIIIFCFMFLIMTIFQKGYELKHEQELTI
ncbi:MAG: DUF2975 domain-containing protein [Candidatus Babeliales bacterium]|nr:DUF2975 domain-containing protein [Candidatus Babeliales bacterium]